MSNPVEVIIPSNPVDLKALKSEIEACVDAKVRARGEQEFIKATVDALAEKFELPKKLISKLINTAYKANIDSVRADTTNLDDLYTAVMGN